jgi:hypothetical protein
LRCRLFNCRQSLPLDGLYVVLRSALAMQPHVLPAAHLEAAHLIEAYAASNKHATLDVS